MLYQRVNDDQARYRGKTRADFEALEASIHAYTGSSPIDDTNVGGNDALSLLADASSQALLNSTNAPSPTIAAGHRQSQIQAELVPPESGVEAIPESGNHDFWNEPWPLWGDQQFMPFAVGGSPFDSNFNMDPPA